MIMARMAPTGRSLLAEVRNSTAADTTAMHATRRIGSSTLKSASQVTSR